MSSLFTHPIDRVLADRLRLVDRSYKTALFLVGGIMLLAFGFEMTNLTIHHDDVIQLFIQDNKFQMDLGRFGFAWLHYYTQSDYIMPFVQMAEGIFSMSLYGVVVAQLWGLRRTMDITLVAAIIGVFPYMAQMFQYNSSMATYSLAHLLAALGVWVSLRRNVASIIIAAVLYAAAFSIYQSVLSNAATIFLVWALSRIIADDTGSMVPRGLFKDSGAAIISVVAGGILYLAAIWMLDIDLASYQGTDKAFSLGDGLNLKLAFTEVLHGTRSFFFWPEHYLPGYLKTIQLLLLLVAGLVCLWYPKGVPAKLASVILLGLATLAPRLLEVLHPQGTFHNLTLTGYAIIIAGAAMVILRFGQMVVKNLATLLIVVLIGGYVVNCNWISTVNYLNTLAHYSTMTQILARVRAIPDTSWDGKTIAVAGSYAMRTDFPYKRSTGVANNYMDAPHMQRITRLMRDDAVVVAVDESTPAALTYAETHPVWPHPKSVAVLDGMAVVVLSHPTVQIED